MINNSATLTQILNAAQEDKYVLLNGNNGSLKVESVGELPDSGRRVKWVRAVDSGDVSVAELNAHSVFTAEMQTAFGEKISAMAMDKVSLGVSDNKQVLSSDEIKAAVLRAKEIQSLYEGIMLPTRLEFSAVRKTPQFVACCKELGIQPSDLPAETVDMLLDKALSNYCAENGPMIDHATSYHLLAETIKNLSADV
ncbi:hypothetical protein [Thalassospira sp.]|uniref:hypothetical protein n=1 Tax=Thalassospira sp. TaxID=1912094 RepID=UPI000C5999D2|nr:hypothetical protein [Thalassospira sp.]MBC05431.1 hypothetical protein [Thalassospira sp.]|tara:strand:- start:2276 stop:2863 length:588 start_codon:yes stop_codon:yes gene_type:complete